MSKQHNTAAPAFSIVKDFFAEETIDDHSNINESFESVETDPNQTNYSIPTKSIMTKTLVKASNGNSIVPKSKTKKNITKKNQTLQQNDQEKKSLTNYESKNKKNDHQKTHQKIHKKTAKNKYLSECSTQRNNFDNNHIIREPYQPLSEISNILENSRNANDKSPVKKKNNLKKISKQDNNQLNNTIIQEQYQISNLSKNSEVANNDDEITKAAPKIPRQKVSLMKSLTEENSSANVDIIQEPSPPSTSNREEKRDRNVKSKRKQNKPKVLNRKLQKEMIKLQKATDLIGPKLPFSRLIREILMFFCYGGNTLRITPEALYALQESAEMYLTQLFQDSYLCTIHRGRVTLLVQDMKLVKALRRLEI